MSNDLSQKHCVPCEGGAKPLTKDEAATHLAQLEGWELNDEAASISKVYTRDDFADALAFVNAVGEIAEAEGHHPDILIHGYNKATITLSTHAIGGLSENDFIVAAKIDESA